MLITDQNKKHYVVIKSLRRLLSRQNSKHKESQHFCINCLQGFAERKSIDEHYVYCRSNEAVRIQMPNRKPIVEYSDGQYQFKVPFMMYADFELILEPIQGVSNDPNTSSTRGVNVHTPSGWCVCSKFWYRDITNPLTQYRGPDCVRKFCEHIISEAKRLYNSFPEKLMEPLTKLQLNEYAQATKCQGASNNPNVSSTKGVNVHTPSGWCVYSKFGYGDVTNPCAQYRGLDCVSKFC